MDDGVWDRVAGFFCFWCFSVWCVPKFHGGIWDKQIEELIYARGLLPRAPVASVTGSGGKFLHSPALAQCNRAGRGCTEGTFEEHICSCSAGEEEEGLSTATAREPAPAPARLTAHQSGILAHRKGRMLRIQQRASRSRYIWLPDYPHPRLMRGCIQVMSAFQILRYAAAVHPDSISAPTHSSGVTGEVLS
jgi:hypothetical protein